MIPFLDRLHAAQRVLIAGCGGGFDVFAGLPLGIYMAARKSSVVYANLSFTNLPQCGGARIDPTTWLITTAVNDLSYFPEKYLAEWLLARGIEAPVYAFAKTGVLQLSAAYGELIKRHEIDLVVLVDGGTDSVIFGDEPGLGTVSEDALSIVAACQAAGTKTVLACLGFGIDHFHGVSHFAYLENVASLIQSGGFLGGFSLVKGTVEADAFLDLVNYANQRQPERLSIVCNSVASALRGKFGNHQTTDRTGGSELFINPLMIQYWAFEAQSVVEHMQFSEALKQTASFDGVCLAIEKQRRLVRARPRKPIPL